MLFLTLISRVAAILLAVVLLAADYVASQAEEYVLWTTVGRDDEVAR